MVIHISMYTGYVYPGLNELETEHLSTLNPPEPGLDCNTL